MTARNLLLLIILVFLIFFSGFFSATETAMMSLNRYRLRHAARKGNLAAKRVMSLLSRPDRLLGVILIGNTFANVFASAVTTMLAAHFFGELGILLVTVALTLVILIFAESTPKTLAALYPEQIALPSSAILKFLLKIFYPLVWVINVIGNSLLRIFGAKFDMARLEVLSIDELRTLLDENKSKLSDNYKKMLLRILDLEQVTVEEIMVPRNGIFGIDINQSWEEILPILFNCPFSFVPLYKDDINQAQGMLNLRKVLISLQQKSLKKEDLFSLCEEIYFIPKEAMANQQLLNFREQGRTIGLVVDEYGDIQGLITLQTIVEEIVGEFTKEVEFQRSVVSQKDGSYLVNAALDIRDLNEIMNLKLPVQGPRTLSGLIIEYLEMIPKPGICTRINGYPIEIVRVSHNMVKLVKIWPGLFQKNEIIQEGE